MNLFRDMVSNFVSISSDVEILERKFFDKRKSEIDRAKETDTVQRKRDALEDRAYYRKNKAEIRKNQKIYVRKAKAQPSLVTTHRE